MTDDELNKIAGHWCSKNGTKGRGTAFIAGFKFAMNEVLPQADVSGSLDFDKMEKRLDEALAKETPESLNEWLKNKRQ